MVRIQKRKIPIAVAYGDGVGPDIMAAVLAILKAANAPIEPEVIELGKKVYQQGFEAGITDEGLATVCRTKVLLKAPIISPHGKGNRSVNTALSKKLGLHTKVQLGVACSPYIPTHHPDMNVVVIRDIAEDLYIGVEYRQTTDMYQALKQISRSQCEKTIRCAFEYATRFRRKKISCFSKDNILSMTDGLFHHVFHEISQDYPDLVSEHYLIDVGVANFVENPEQFDVIIAENLYGDILSEVAMKLVGAINMSGSVYYGDDVALFEASHNALPNVMEHGTANPSGLLHAAIRLLLHLNETASANLIKNAWLKMLEEGIHTADIYRIDYSERKVNTEAFAQALIERLGEKPIQLPAVDYNVFETGNVVESESIEKTYSWPKKQLVGVDVFIDLPICGVEAIAEKLQSMDLPLTLAFIANRGAMVWPETKTLIAKYGADCWRCRFYASKDYKPIVHDDVITLLEKLKTFNIDFIKTENLYTFDDMFGLSV